MWSASFIVGKTDVTSTKELLDRETAMLNWINTGSYISDGQKTYKVKKVNSDWTKAIKAPPKGSAFLLYKDIAGNSYDGYFNFTSTEAEVQYLLTGVSIYLHSTNEELKSKLEDVADNLQNKVFFSKLKHTEDKVALIPRLTQYNFKTKTWETLKGEVYIKDILNTANALMTFSEAINTNKYDLTILELLNTIVTLQKVLNQSDDVYLHDGMYHKVYNYEDGDYYTPSWNSYTFTLTVEMNETMNKAFERYHNKTYFFVKEKYMKWVQRSIATEDFWNQGISYTGLNGKGDFIRNLEKSWNQDDFVNSEDMIKVIIGLMRWNPEKKYPQLKQATFTEKVLGNWQISELVKHTGRPSFNHSNSILSLTYLAIYFDLMGEKENRDDVMLYILNEQRLKGDAVSKGVWLRGVVTDIEYNLLIIKYLNNLKFQQLQFE
jgi:hypothetical protein